MKRPVVFRMQDKDGRGPWKPGFSHQWVEDRPDHDRLAPWYEEFKFSGNPMNSDKNHFGCGCTSEDQLKRWFSESEYQTLLKYGYQAVKMDVDRVLGESTTQCVFERTEPLKRRVTAFNLYPKNLEKISKVEAQK